MDKEKFARWRLVLLRLVQTGNNFIKGRYGFYHYVSLSAIGHVLVLTTWALLNIEAPELIKEDTSIEVDLIYSPGEDKSRSAMRKEDPMDENLLPQLPKRFSIIDEEPEKKIEPVAAMENPAEEDKTLAFDALKKKVQILTRATA